MHTTKKIQVEIVSVEEEIFSGEAGQVIATGTLGELGIMPGHMPLLTFLKPGHVRLLNNGKEDVFYISSGVLEVQPDIVTILADTISRAQDLDEDAALKAKKRAEKILQDKKSNVAYYAAAADLAEALAQLRTIELIRNKP